MAQSNLSSQHPKSSYYYEYAAGGKGTEFTRMKAWMYIQTTKLKSLSMQIWIPISS